jgi:hypothetical protein
MPVMFASRGGVASFIHPIRSALFAAIAILAGCTVQNVSVYKLEIHQSEVNRTGLTAVRTDDLLEVTMASPQLWDLMPTTSNMIYSHRQWRSPDKHVGMGVAHLHMPVVCSPQTLIWFA